MDILSLTPDVWETVNRRQASQLSNVGAEVLTWQGVAEPFTCVFMSVDGSAHFMCAVEDDSSVPAIRSLRGLEIQMLQDFSVVGRDRQNYLDLRCTSRIFLLPFTRVVQDVATLVLRDRLLPSDAVVQVAEEWRAFWSLGNRAPLSEQVQRGLLGELLVFELLLDAGVNASDSWAGPDDDRHDFRTAHSAVEVKTCLGLPRRHTIGSLDQLAITVGLPLFLISIQLDRADGGPIDLPALIFRLTNRLSGASRITFEDKLGAVGYSPLHITDYERHGYVLGEVKAYQVDDSFPKVVRTSFSSPLSPAVERVSYVVNVESEPTMDLAFVLRLTAGGG
jgi:hypothetical protein